MKSDRRAPVAIIGGGYSGTILAAQLARRGIGSILVDGSGRQGRGVAYSTPDPAHLLNVRAEGMSAWVGEPGHFAGWFENEGGEPRGFAQRRLFGGYLCAILDEAKATGLVSVAEATAIGAERTGDGWRLSLDDGEAVEAEALVLAIGNQQPDPPGPLVGLGARFIADPWGTQARAAIDEVVASGEPVLIVGTGLTMVDVVVSLDAAGYGGHALALSRRGQIPRAHADFDPAPIALDALAQGNLRALMRGLRRRSGEVGWRAATDALRPHSQALWQGLGTEQQQRFLRHVRPWWDVHRHRIAPEIAQRVAGAVAAGWLEIAAGRIVSARDTGDGVEVEYRPRGSAAARTGRFAYVFNCTGPLHSLKRTRDALLRSLLDAGQISPDALLIGLDVDESSRAAPRLWALGPLTKGRYWEIIAVPDIREQAAAVADDIQLELGLND